MAQYLIRQVGISVGSARAARANAGLPPLAGAGSDNTILGATSTSTQVAKPPVSAASQTAALRNAGLA